MLHLQILPKPNPVISMLPPRKEMIKYLLSCDRHFLYTQLVFLLGKGSYPEQLQILVLKILQPSHCKITVYFYTI